MASTEEARFPLLKENEIYRQKLRRNRPFGSGYSSRLSLTIIVLLVPVYMLAHLLMDPGGSVYIQYTAVTGYFLQDDPDTSAPDFDYATKNLGLINRSYNSDIKYDPRHEKTQWQRFEYYVSKKNEESEANVEYKVLYMGRHGEGYHNVAESYYGKEAWDCYWSTLDGNGTSTWADAELTFAGIAQAQAAQKFWGKALQEGKIPLPETYYVSPLRRCLHTAQGTFADLDIVPPHRPFRPVIKELLREALGIHTCDRRSDKSWIQQNYPFFSFEADFADSDPLWSATERESRSAHTVRMKTLLDDIFTHDRSTFISFTTHSGSIGAILRAIGHRDFDLRTGAIIPVLLKAETIAGTPPVTSVAPGKTKPACLTSPTSLVTPNLSI